MKLGFIGLKGHVGAVLAGAKQLGDVQVAGVAEEDAKLLEAFLKRETAVPKSQGYKQWRHLVEHSMLDVCCVADESGVRFEQLLTLIERDIHIVSEKPLVTTLADLERLRAGHRGSRKVLGGGRQDLHERDQVRDQVSLQAGDRAVQQQGLQRRGVRGPRPGEG